MLLKILIWVLLGALSSPLSAWAQVLFEGYYKIKSLHETIGYSVQRYESLDGGRFKATVFIKTNALGGNLTESIITESDSAMRPIKLSYTGIIGKVTKMIDAEVKNGNLVAEIREGSKVEKKNLPLEPGIFFSGILIYAILKSPQGLVPDTQYNYKAIAEENLETVSGKAFVQNYDDFRGKIKSLKVLNEFKSLKFYSWVTERGEVLETTAPTQGITTELVPLKEDATRGQVLPEKALKSLFGAIPSGENNMAYRAYQKGEWPAQKEEDLSQGFKTQPIPPKKGIHTK